MKGIPMAEEIINKLEQIGRWLKENEFVESCKTNNDLMRLAVEVSNHVRLLMVIASGLIPQEMFKGYNKESAVIVGHFVRLYKLYDSASYHVSKNQGEIGAIFTRLFFETSIRMAYLIKNGSASIHNFIFISYRSDKEILKDLLVKQSQRKLIPIEERILSGIRWRLQEDGIDEKRLLSNTEWKLDGKDFREIMKDIDIGHQYAYGFGSQSSTVHGNWRDIRAHHLTFQDGLYNPEWEYDSVDPRNITPLSIMATDAIVAFLSWNKTDPDGFVSKHASNLGTYAIRLDRFHEDMLNTGISSDQAPRK